MLDTFIPPDAWDCFSECGLYRYELGQRWRRGPLACFVALNPSVASKDRPDPSYKRMIGFTRTWGHAGVVVVNTNALVSTDPDALLEHPDPVGPENDAHIRGVMGSSAVVVCAWGGHRAAQVRAERVLAIIREEGRVPMCLVVNGDGSPSHPLYLKKTLVPIEYVPNNLDGVTRPT